MVMSRAADGVLGSVYLAMQSFDMSTVLNLLFEPFCAVFSVVPLALTLALDLA